MNLSLLLQPRKLLSIAMQRYKERSTLRAAVRAGAQRFAKHPLYRLDLIPEGCASRPTPQSDDGEIIRRILKAYKKAKAKQPSAGATFNVSNEWIHIYNRILGPVIRALHSEDLDAIRRMYSNFYRDSCSQGLAGLPFDIQTKLFQPGSTKFERQVLQVDLLHRLELWKERTEGRYPVSALRTPAVGNPFGHTVDGIFVAGGADYHHYYAQSIAELCPPDRKALVLELGGGFGGMAWFLLRDHPQISYVDFDLPEALALASYYLLTAFPDLPVVLYGEAPLTAKTIEAARVLMMPSFEILNLPSKSVDVAFNSYSLAEMSAAAITEYLAEIARCTKGHILHVNHTRNSVVSADDFGMERLGFVQVGRRLAGWTAGLNPASDEFEFLYRAS